MLLLLFVVTNPRSVADTEAATDTIRRRNTRAPILVGAYQVVGALTAPDGREIPPGSLSGRRLLAFAGLGSPGGFAHTLVAAGVDVAGLVEYPDHYWFAERDLEELGRHALASGADGLATSEKDWVRLRNLPLPSMPIYCTWYQWPSTALYKRSPCRPDLRQSCFCSLIVDEPGRDPAYGSPLRITLRKWHATRRNGSNPELS